MSTLPSTFKQREFIADLTRRLKLSPEWFADHCQEHYGGQPEELDIATCSALIDELLSWQESPAKLLRAQGQQPLFEVTP